MFVPNKALSQIVALLCLKLPNCLYDFSEDRWLKAQPALVKQHHLNHVWVCKHIGGVRTEVTLNVVNVWRCFLLLNCSPFGYISYRVQDVYWGILYVIGRGFAVGIYTTNSPEACQYVAENCQANILVVENHKQLQKILQVMRVQDPFPFLNQLR